MPNPGLIPAAVAVGGSIISGVMGNEAADTQADATRSAADASSAANRYAADLQLQAQREANALQREMYDRSTSRLDNMYRDLRNDTAQERESGRYAHLMLRGATPEVQERHVNIDPGFEFRRQQGLEGLEQRAAAGGSLRSGNTLKALMEYGQDLASQEYGAAWNRAARNTDAKLNHLRSLAGIGQVASQQVASGGQNYANSVNALNQNFANSVGGAGMNTAAGIGNMAMVNAANQGNAAMAGAAGRASMYQGLGNSLGQAFASPGVQNSFANWFNGFGSNVGSGQHSVQGNADYYYDL